MAPVLGSVVARATGRDGVDLGLRLEGTDEDGDVALVVVRFLEHSGLEAELFDHDQDGKPESGESAFRFDVPVSGSTELSGSVTLRRFLESASQVEKLEVRLRDKEGLESNVVMVSVSSQPVKHLGEFCDPTYWDDRCDVGLGCRGDPTQCSEGVAPAIDKVAYLSTSFGPKILVEGVDPDDDMKKVEVDFLDQQGNPIQIDLDNDETPESSSFAIDARGSSQGGRFFVELSPSDSFSEQVKQIAAVPFDVVDRSGDRRTARLSAPPVRSRGQSCDPRGFSVCSKGLVCSPGDLSAVNTCQPVATERLAECGAAPVLGPTTGKMSLIGFATGSSVWDPPEGCAAHDPTSRPEGIAILSLPNPAARVLIRTDLPGTTFDTVVYLTGACEDANAPVISCDDDARTSASSRLLLENVPAHDYLIVIDSYDAEGGVFELSVEIE